MREDLQRWFSTGSYQGSRYAAEQLAAQKDGQKVSVVLPAKNEAATVGQIVSALRTRLVEAVPLLDEIIVIDSNSTDATSAVAAAAGAKVARQEHILPELGNVPGKGVGLASVKSIVETYNGSIWVESQVGRGSTFRVRLPRINDDRSPA